MPTGVRTAAALVLAAVTAGCASDGTYSRADVEQAFSREGFELRAVDDRLDHPEAALLAPSSGEKFAVYFFADDDLAAEVFETLRSQATADAFDLREANVVVSSDGGVQPAVRRRIRSALATLRETER